jgi:transposase
VARCRRMPRIETVVDVKSTLCPCCAGTLHRIGEDVSEWLDIVPAQFRVMVARPNYACRDCTDVIVQTPAPAVGLDAVQLAELHEKATTAIFLRHLLKVVPYKIHTVLTDNDIQFMASGAGGSAVPLI